MKTMKGMIFGAIASIIMVVSIAPVTAFAAQTSQNDDEIIFFETPSTPDARFAIGQWVAAKHVNPYGDSFSGVVTERYYVEEVGWVYTVQGQINMMNYARTYTESQLVSLQ